MIGRCVGRWGVKQINVATDEGRWYTNDGHSQDDAIAIAVSCNKPPRREEYPTDLMGNRVRFEAALIGKDDEY